MTTVPLMPGFVRGVINLRGAVVPVIDLQARFGRARARASARRPASSSSTGQRDGERVELGLLVDAVSEVIDIAAERHRTPPPNFGASVRRDFIRGMGKLAARAVRFGSNLCEARDRAFDVTAQRSTSTLCQGRVVDRLSRVARAACFLGTAEGAWPARRRSTARRLPQGRDGLCSAAPLHPGDRGRRSRTRGHAAGDPARLLRRDRADRSAAHRRRDVPHRACRRRRPARGATPAPMPTSRSTRCTPAARRAASHPRCARPMSIGGGNMFPTLSPGPHVGDDNVALGARRAGRATACACCTTDARRHRLPPPGLDRRRRRARGHSVAV